MGLERAEYQDLFNAKGTAEKNYKIRERTSDFFWRGSRDAVGIDIGTGVRAPCCNQRTPLPIPSSSPAGRPGRLREVKREVRPVQWQGERAHPAPDDTDVAAQACLPGGVGKRRGHPSTGLS